MKLVQFILLASAISMAAAETPNATVPPDHAQRMERGLKIFQQQIRSRIVSKLDSKGYCAGSQPITKWFAVGIVLGP